MRIYEFTPYSDTESTVFSINIEEAKPNKAKVSTLWRDFDRHLSSHTRMEEKTCVKFKQQLLRFWNTVCRMERKYNTGVVEDIIASIADPDLREFLVQNS